jgi:hypothetical protein
MFMNSSSLVFLLTVSMFLKSTHNQIVGNFENIKAFSPLQKWGSHINLVPAL